MGGASNHLLVAMFCAAALIFEPLECVVPTAFAAEQCQRMREIVGCGSSCEFPPDDSSSTPDCPIVLCTMVQRPLLRRWPADVRAEQRALEPQLPASSASTDLSRRREFALSDRICALPASVDPLTLFQLRCMLLE